MGSVATDFHTAGLERLSGFGTLEVGSGAEEEAGEDGQDGDDEDHAGQLVVELRFFGVGCWGIRVEDSVESVGEDSAEGCRSECP